MVGLPARRAPQHRYIEHTSEISSRTLETTAHIPSQAGVPGEVCGRHRRQGLKPAASADAADGYHRRLAGSLSGTGQIERQDTPVVSTPAKTRPSERRSRLLDGLPADSWIEVGLFAKRSFLAVNGVGTNRRPTVYCHALRRPICPGKPIFRVHPRASDSANYI